MTLTEIVVSSIIAIVGGLFTTYLYAKINSENIKHYLFLGLSLFCFLISMLILIFVLLEKIDINIVVVASVVALNMATLAFQNIHLKKNRYRETKEQLRSKELLDFNKEAKKICGDSIGETLGEIAIALNKIKLLFNESYIRGISNPKFLAPMHFKKGLPYGKETTTLETNVEDIYKEMLKGLNNHRGILSTDIDCNMNAAKTSNGDYRWIADGLDGGLHFLRNIPIYTSSIALQIKEKGHWTTIIGAILIPTTNEFFFAVKDKGAYLNNWNTRLPLENRNDRLDDCIFYIEDPNINTILNESSSKYDECFVFLKDVKTKIKKTRNFNVGSFGLAYLAKGSWDAYISLPGTTSMYDSEAGKLLVEESGNSEDESKGIVIKEEIRVENGIDMGSRILATSENILVNIKKDAVLYDNIKTLFPSYKEN